MGSALRVMDVCKEQVRKKSWQYIIAYQPKNSSAAKNQAFSQKVASMGEFFLRAELQPIDGAKGDVVYVDAERWLGTTYVAAKYFATEPERTCRWQLVPRRN